MTPTERLRWAVEPVQDRAVMLLWGGLLLFIASGGVSAVIEIPAPAKLLLYLGMFAGWCLAACGMIGYMRNYYAEAAEEARKVQAQRPKE